VELWLGSSQPTTPNNQAPANGAPLKFTITTTTNLPN
jgi:hypothetical protein